MLSCWNLLMRSPKVKEVIINNNETELNVFDELSIDDTHLDVSVNAFKMQNNGSYNSNQICK